MSATPEGIRVATGEREVVTIGGGCFWCTEAVFTELRGVESVESGYSGGTVPRPSYEQVCTGTTGHAEAVQITFDPSVLSLHDLLTVFFTTHDPTTLNRQGNDSGTQYRSVVFYRNADQKATTERVIQELEAEHLYRKSFVTQVVPFAEFYPAEEYHRNYFARNPERAYCQLVIAPKVAKFRSKFTNRLKPA
jgi:peptide-methionine (S)-S-oxide reductase